MSIPTPTAHPGVFTAAADRAAADRTVAATRRAAWLTLATATAASMAGNIYHAAHYGSGSAVAMGAAAVVPVLLLLAVHLVGGLAASRREGRVHRSVHPAAVIGVSALAAAALAASFLALRDLLLRERFDPIAAGLIPAAVDVAVVVATLALFSLAPRSDASATEAAHLTEAETAHPRDPQIAQGTRTAEAETTQGAHPDAPPEARTPRTARAPYGEIKTAHPTPSAEVEVLAARIVALRIARKPVPTVAAVLAAHEADWSVTRIEREIGVHRDVIKKIVSATAADSVAAPTRLTAVH